MGLARLIWRGEVHDVDLGEPAGHEGGFVRPALIVSSDVINNGPGGLVGVIPISRMAHGLRSHVELDTGASGLNHVSYARCDQIRMISSTRLLGRRGTVSPEQLATVNQALRFILDL